MTSLQRDHRRKENICVLVPLTVFFLLLKRASAFLFALGATIR
jgi:hypothetical protein